MPETTVFPRSAWHYQPGRVPALHGLRWLAGAWRLVAQNPRPWLPAMLVFSIVQGFFILIAPAQPWFSLLMTPYTMLGAALLLCGVLGEPVAPLYGPEAPPHLERRKWLQRLPKAVLLNILSYGWLCWIFVHFTQPEAHLRVYVLPLVVVLVVLSFDLLCIIRGIYGRINAILIITRASYQILVLIPILIGASMAAAWCEPLLIWLTTRLEGTAPPALLAAFLSVAKYACYFAIATWMLLAQAVGAMLNLPPFGAALVRAARAMWRNAPAFALHILALSAAATLIITGLEHLPYSAPVHAFSSLILAGAEDAELAALALRSALPFLACAALALYLFIPALMIPQWLMVCDIFRDAAAPEDEKNEATRRAENAARASPALARPARLPALRGLHWLCVDVWRLIFQEPLLWLPVGAVLALVWLALLFPALHIVIYMPALALPILPLLAALVPAHAELPKNADGNTPKGAPFWQRLLHALALEVLLLTLTIAATAVLSMQATMGAALLSSAMNMETENTLFADIFIHAAFPIYLFLTFWALLAQALAARGVPFFTALAGASRAVLRPACLLYIAALAGVSMWATGWLLPAVFLPSGLEEMGSPFLLFSLAAILFPPALVLQAVLAPRLMAREMFEVAAQPA